MDSDFNDPTVLNERVSIMKCLRTATPAQVALIEIRLQQMWRVATIRGETAVLEVAINEIVPGVRPGTITWVMSMLVKKADNIVDAGYLRNAGKWRRAADMLRDLLRELDDD